MPNRDIVVIGASAGGVEALITLARALPADFPAAILAVLHVPPQGSSVLPQLIARAGRLQARHAIHLEPVRSGRWYIAPPDHHLLVRDRQIHLGRGPTESGHRPSVDPLFRSAAAAYGRRVIGVVLSGSLDDGTAGLMAVKLAGGLAVVQDPADAMYPSMPQSALENVAVDHVAQLEGLGELLVRLATEPIAREVAMAEHSERLAGEAAIADQGQRAIEELEARGIPSVFACPDCHGVLFEVREGELVRYRCRVGHAYLPQALSAAQADKLEEALWIALRTLKENRALSIRLAERAQDRNLEHMAQSYRLRANEAEQRATVIEDVLKRGRINAVPEEENFLLEAQGSGS